jgi:hypothetical protein
MIKVKNILKKENLISAAGLGIGSVAAEVVTNKVAPMVLKTETTAKYAPAIPILAGMVIQTGKGVIKSIGHGMIASGVASLVKAVLPATVKEQFMISGTDEVLMAGVEQPLMATAPLMGTSEFSSDSFDYTSGSAGEMSY